uniref:Uncharacterized protein n=1 Tax=Tanacetum cinerariifolium TaxID=118510 RepID=A0A6L2N6R1_TANCI|nr:hypothetical protein [Tanacetum cinerariifolium]
MELGLMRVICRTWRAGWGCDIEEFPFTYLGLPVGEIMRRVNAWAHLVENFKKRGLGDSRAIGGGGAWEWGLGRYCEDWWGGGRRIVCRIEGVGSILDGCGNEIGLEVLWVGLVRSLKIYYVFCNMLWFLIIVRIDEDGRLMRMESLRSKIDQD